MARRRRHTREFKLMALARLEAASDVAGLAAELGIDRGLLYKWDRVYRSSGASGLRHPGERAAGATAGKAEASGAGVWEPSSPERPGQAALERKIAEQALELDFFRTALQHFAGRRRRNGGPGETGSTP